ncbi:MAG: hypothetical protein IPL78_34480 [Chloroflexi bacterium]|nr:hypothetical protein [Chloroflexota bacterium]
MSSRISRLKRAILESFDVERVDLEVNLVSIFQMSENHRLIHQLPRAVIERLFSQAVQVYEIKPDATTYELIEKLLPRTHIELSAASDSLSSLLAQPRKLLEALETSNEDELDSLLYQVSPKSLEMNNNKDYNKYGLNGFMAHTCIEALDMALELPSYTC